MSSKKDLVLILDIDNTQEDYAQCMKFLSIIEEKRSNENQASKVVFEDPISIKIRRFWPNESHNIKEGRNFVSWLEKEVLPNNKKIRDIAPNIIFESTDQFNPVYYFRIHSTPETDIVGLLYFILMLQSDAVPDDRILAFLVPDNGDLYPYWPQNVDSDMEEFKRFSHFTRLLSEKYSKCYGAMRSNNITSIDKFSKNEPQHKKSESENDEKTDGAQSTFIPMIEINAESYIDIQKKWAISYQNYEDAALPSLKEWLKTIYPENCDRSYIRQFFHFSNRRLGDAFKGKIRNVAKKRYIMKTIKNTVINNGGITALEYALFGLMVGNRTQIDWSDAQEAWDAISCLQEASNLAFSIMQILENIVYHASSHNGIFTFRIHDNKEHDSYLKSEYKAYDATISPTTIEFLVADTSQTETIISTFLKNKEKATDALVSVEKAIRISDFLGEYSIGNAAQEWIAARKENPTRCLGLLVFANSLRFLRATIKIRSCTEYLSDDNKYFYYRNYLVNNNESIVVRSFIPGTQISIVVPMNPIQYENKGTEEVPFYNESAFAETYEGLSSYLDFKSINPIPPHLFENELNEFITKWKIKSQNIISSQAIKDSLAVHWKTIFDSILTTDIVNNHVIIIDLNDLSVNDNFIAIEPLCKGFLMCALFKYQNASYIIIQNLTEDFIRVLGNTLAANPYILSNSKVQICLYAGNYSTKIPLIGGNLSTILRNLNEYQMLRGGAPLIQIPDNYDEVSNKPEVFPFDVFSAPNQPNYFETNTIRRANRSITEIDMGYSLKCTHMRLGNKVHIDSFFEMSIYFQKQDIAKRTAFLFIHKLLHQNNPDQVKFEELLKGKNTVIFYGYTSYSRAIVSAMVEITQAYIKNKNYECRIEFAIFQTDLAAEATSEKVQMYLSELYTHGEETKIIQIVPISSSLTTFNKMWAFIKRHEEITNQKEPYANLTAFWVRDSNTNDKRLPSDLELPYWESINLDDKHINAYVVNPMPHYLVSVDSKWRNPLTCEKCFPHEEIMEFPLVETDITSTIPTQQFFQKAKAASSKYIHDDENEKRIAHLFGCIFFGHIKHYENHYQYHIDMRKFFQKEKDNIRHWLRELAICHEKEYTQCTTVLVSPQQSSNVEFSQYVNNYYLHGNAVMLSLNAEKEFRSNVKVEYYDIARALKLESDAGHKIHFIYVDTSITTGGTYNRIESLMQSLIPNAIKKNHVFDKIFLLVNRLSFESKNAYVIRPETDFYQYCNLYISSMRTFGDSCIGCKLQNEAKHFYRYASTRGISSYWEEKMYKNDLLPFEKWGEINLQFMHSNLLTNETIAKAKEFAQKQQEKGFVRAICAHRAQICLIDKRGMNQEDYFTGIRELIDEVLVAMKVNNSETKSSPVFLDDFGNAFECDEENLLFACFKVLCRPFFTFDFKIRCCITDLFLLLVTYLLTETHLAADEIENIIQKTKDDECKEEKSYLTKNNNIQWILNLAENIRKICKDEDINELKFINKYLLKGLTDLRSNYILRKNTISKLVNYLNNKSDEEFADFFDHYIRYILRITNVSSDETKSIWLENLLLFGSEYVASSEEEEHLFISNPAEAFGSNKAELFNSAWETLFVENSRVLYKGMIDLYKSLNGKEPGGELASQIIQKELKEYHMWDFCRFLNLDNRKGVKKEFPIKELGYIQASLSFLKLLDNNNNEGRYHFLREEIEKLSEFITPITDRVLIFAKQSLETKYLELPKYYFIEPDTKRENKLIELGNIASTYQSNLEKKSFYVGSGFVLIMLDNNYVNLKKSFEKNPLLRLPAIQKIEPVYIYIPCDTSDKIKALMLIRSLLIYRSKLIEWLEKDFNNNAMPQISNQRRWAEMLSVDKASDHNTNEDIDSIQRCLMRGQLPSLDTSGMKLSVRHKIITLHKNFGESEKTKEWLLLKSYTNSKIARLYRAMIRNDGMKELHKIHSLYCLDRNESCWEQKLKNLGDAISVEIVEGQSREPYFRNILDTIKFSFKDVEDNRQNADNDRYQYLVKHFQQFNIISIPYNNEDYGYNSEFINCILLDYCYSAIRHGKNWERLIGGGSSNDSGRQFRYLAQSPLDEKCEVKVSRKPGGNYGGVDYDFLVLENEKLNPNIKKSQVGMSLRATRWYIDNLWKYIPNPEDLMLPAVYVENENAFRIELPILKRSVLNE